MFIARPGKLVPAMASALGIRRAHQQLTSQVLDGIQRLHAQLQAEQRVKLPAGQALAERLSPHPDRLPFLDGLGPTQPAVTDACAEDEQQHASQDASHLTALLGALCRTDGGSGSVSGAVAAMGQSMQLPDAQGEPCGEHPASTAGSDAVDSMHPCNEHAPATEAAAAAEPGAGAAPGSHGAAPRRALDPLNPSQQCPCQAGCASAAGSAPEQSEAARGEQQQAPGARVAASSCGGAALLAQGSGECGAPPLAHGPCGIRYEAYRTGLLARPFALQLAAALSAWHVTGAQVGRRA